MINGVSVSHPSSSCYIHVSQDSRSPDKFSLTKTVLDSVRITRGTGGCHLYILSVLNILLHSFPLMMIRVFIWKYICGITGYLSTFNYNHL